jgi:hypothetical protein
LSISVVYWPFGAFLTRNVSDPFVPVGPVPVHARVRVRFQMTTVTAAPTTGLPQLSRSVTIADRSLLFLLREYVIAVTVTWVGAQPTVIMILELPVLPPLSVDEAVIVCRPSIIFFETLLPVPRAPCLFEDQLITRLESVSSLTVPAKLTVLPVGKTVPLPGRTIVTCGAKLTGPEPVPT